MTDVTGRAIDFSDIGYGTSAGGAQEEEERRSRKRTAKLPDHVRGILGSTGSVYHQALLDAYAKVIDQR